MDVVFFDASVLFKAAVTRFLLGAAQSGEFRAIWSDLVVEEARRSLQAAKRPHAAVALEQNVGLVRDPVVAQSNALAATLKLTDVGDRHVLAAAANGEASVLVTCNVRHFDPGEAASLGIVIRTPDKLAVSIAARNPHALTWHVQRTPPGRLSRYVELLSRELPETLKILAPHLDG
jgi:PIN domain